MADTKISALTGATTPVAGTEVIPVVQGGQTRKVSIADLTAGRAISATQLTLTTGNVIVTSGKGIDFSATDGTGTSELFDDYEEGTWTVSFYDAGSGGNVSSTTTTGYYTKVGNCVTATFGVSNISTSGMTAGNAIQFTLPFTSAATIGNAAGSCVLEQFTFPASRTAVVPNTSANNARGFFRAFGSAVDASTILVSQLSTGVSDIERCTVTYFS